MVQPIITVVSGTINRLPLLKRMIESARREARGLPICFIIVDSNSTDGTEEWCQTQPDIQFVQTGEPKGAISAFTTGGKLSKSKYTILANDDIEFLPYSIVTAYRVLEDNTTCGAVAFADNRLAKDQSKPTYATQKHPTRNQYGDIVWTTYAQVGMYRTELMITGGVWGADDPLFGGAGAWTYGGDNYLSAKIFEFGYHICNHPTVKVHDYVHDDEIRKRNYDKHKLDGKLYRERFNNSGAIWASKRNEAPIINLERPLRVLYLPEIEPFFHNPQVNQMKGLYHAMVNAGWDVIQYNYTLEGIKDKQVMQTELYNLVISFKPDLLFMQVHNTHFINAHLIKTIRAKHPSMVVVNFNGDYWRDKLFAPDMIDFLKYVDVQLVVDNAVLPRYEKLGITARYWQIAPETPNLIVSNNIPSHDILFMGSIYSDFRKKLVHYLNELRKEGFNIGLYGMNYPNYIQTNGATYYDYVYSHALIKQAKVFIGVMEFTDTDGYVSNRLFECLQAGGVLLQQKVINADVHLGLINGVHYAVWNDLGDLDELIRYYLRERELAKKMAEAGHQLVLERHQWKNRVEQLIDILEGIANL